MALALAIVVVIALYFYTQIDSEIRRHAENLLARQYPHLSVQVGSARLIKGRGIEIRQLVFADPTRPGPQGHLLVVDELLLVCDAQLPDLLTTQPAIEKLVVRGPKLLASQSAAGHWNLESLLPLPELEGSAREIEIIDGSVQLRRSGKRPIELRGIAATVHKKRRPQTRLDPSIPNPPTNPAPKPTRSYVAQFTAHLTSRFAEKLTLQGHYDTATGELQSQGTAEQLVISRQLIDALLPEDAAPIRDISEIEATANVKQFRLSRPNAQAPLAWSAELDVLRGRFRHRSCPRPATQLAGKCTANSSGLYLSLLTGRCGEASFEFACERTGWDKQAPFALQGRVRDLRCDRDLILALPEGDQIWRRFQPTGVVDAHLELKYDGARFFPVATIRCRDVGLICDKLPYPVKHTTGLLRYAFLQDSPADRQLDGELTTFAGGQELRVLCQLTNPGPQSFGWVDISGKDLPIEEALIQALQHEPARKFIASLHPGGKFDVHWQSRKDQPSAERPHTQLTLEFRDGSVEYDRFAYPLRQITGRVEAKDGHWEFIDLRGVNNGGVVGCSGKMWPSEEGKELHLSMTGENIPLEKDLQAALSNDVQVAWSKLNPAGRVNFTASIQHRTGMPKADIALTVEPSGMSVSLEPSFFPYRLAEIEGSAVFDDGNVKVENFRARHDRTTTVSCTAEFRSWPERGWEIVLNDLNVDRLVADHDLHDALPPELRQLMTKLQPKGGIRIHGSRLRFQRAGPTQPVASDWDLHLDLHQASAQCGVMVTQVFGGLSISGRRDGRSTVAHGQLILDSLMYRGLQFTDIRGPFWTDERESLLGSWATRKLGVPDGRVQAQAYGGNVFLDLRVQREPPSAGAASSDPRDVSSSLFTLDADLAGADLARLALEQFPGQADLRGRIQARLHVEGRGNREETMRRSLQGYGEVHLRDADIYELPQMVAVLKVLRARRPDTTAFTRSDMHFRIQGENLYFDSIEFRGDAVSLLGTGEMNLDRVVNLQFQSVVGRNEVPVVSQLVREASRQVAMLHVTGPLENPSFETEPLPGLNRALQQLQADLEPARRAGSLPRSGQKWNFLGRKLFR